MNTVLSTAVCAVLFIAAPTFGQGASAPEHGANSFDRAVSDGHWWLRLRYRVESVDADGAARDATASTLRTVLGYESAPWYGASFGLEFEDVSVIGGERYNSTVNGMAMYPVVADPESSEVNQAYVNVTPTDDTAVRVGRQRVALGNKRFVGDVGWRQNQQTLDAATARWGPGDGAEVFYGYVDNVNRIFGESSPAGDHRMASHLVNASYDFEGAGKLTGYAYLLDYDSVVALSSTTIGLRFAGKHDVDDVVLSYTGEFASQSDAGDNPNDVSQDYVSARLGAETRGVSVELGKEILGGSGDPGDAFQTPLATLHAFNGWADQFLTTPDTGLEDLFVSLGAKRGAFAFRASWHMFEADSGGADYGDELDASIVWAVDANVRAGVKFADYRADDFSTDTTKAWLWVAYAP